MYFQVKIAGNELNFIIIKILMCITVKPNAIGELFLCYEFIREKQIHVIDSC